MTHPSTRVNNAIWHLLGVQAAGAWHEFSGTLAEVCGIECVKDGDTLAAIRTLNKALLRTYGRERRSPKEQR